MSAGGIRVSVYAALSITLKQGNIIRSGNQFNERKKPVIRPCTGAYDDINDCCGFRRGSHFFAGCLWVLLKRRLYMNDHAAVFAAILRNRLAVGVVVGIFGGYVI